ncbi:MAG: ferritin family protein [Candidatus Latescibacterota bacterium]
MSKFDSIDKILDFAIKEEEAAHDFYMDLAAKMEFPAMKEVFTSFAKEEKGHKAKLLNIKEGKYLMESREKVVDLKIADYLVDVEPSGDLDYQKALILAMKKEKSAFKMYSDLASRVDGELQKTFRSLAQEEAKHKLRFEIEYDDQINKEN